MKHVKSILALALVAGIWALSAAGTAPRPAGPDLTLQVLAGPGGITTFKEGDLFNSDYPQLVVKNVGTAATTGQWITTFRCTPVPNSGPGGTTPKSPLPAEEKFGTTSTPSLAPGQPWTLWVKPNFDPLPAGKFVLSGSIDLAEDVNKSNNYAEITITVNPPLKPITINPVLVAPTIVGVQPKSSVEYTVPVITYKEHSVARPTKGVIIERKSTLSGYQQIAKTVPSGPVQVDKGDGIQKTYQDAAQAPGVYTYRMKAYDDKGESGYSNEMSVVIKAAINQPGQPKIIK